MHARIVHFTNGPTRVRQTQRLYMSNRLHKLIAAVLPLFIATCGLAITGCEDEPDTPAEAVEEQADELEDAVE